MSYQGGGGRGSAGRGRRRGNGCSLGPARRPAPTAGGARESACRSAAPRRGARCGAPDGPGRGAGQSLVVIGPTQSGKTTSLAVRPSWAGASGAGGQRQERSVERAATKSAQELSRGGYIEPTSAVVPRSGRSHNSAAARQASTPFRRSRPAVTRCGRAPVEPSVDAHLPAAPRPQCVAEEIALDAGRQHRTAPAKMAGTAKLVVFPLCVGPITTRDWPAPRPGRQARHTGHHAEEQPTGRRILGATRSGAGRLAGPSEHPWPRARPRRRSPRPSLPLGTTWRRATRHDSEGQNDVGQTRHAYRAVMGRPCRR